MYIVHVNNAGFHRSAKKEDIFKFKAYHLEKTIQVLKNCSVKVGAHVTDHRYSYSDTGTSKDVKYQHVY